MSWPEILTSLEIGLIFGIVALGIYLTFKIIDFPDLTCDGSFVSGAAASAVALKLGLHPALALGCSIIIGALCGLITGMLHVYCRISSLLAGILTAFMLYSINLKIMGDIPNISLLHESTLFSSGYKLLIIFGCAIFVWISLSYLLITDFGLALRSLGQNKRLASINGIRIPALTVVALILSNALVGLGGGLFCQHESFADISEGIGTIIIGLAAVMIGEKILPFRSIWVALFSCLAGSVCYRIIVAFSLHSEWLGLESSQLNLITGIIVILIMVSPQLKIRRRLVS